MLTSVLVALSPPSGIEELRVQVARMERLGVGGALVSDHLFAARGPSPARGSSPARRGAPPDPFVVLAAIGALSESLTLGTIVANIGYVHPAFVLRHFAELACLYGGDRVLAGIGAGWAPEEFDALGLVMPGHAARMDRLAESLRLARQLFDEGMASIEGSSVVARDLPFAPMPESPPRLMLGGGSDRLLELAGAFADHLDLNGSSRRLRLGRALARERDGLRRLTTTVADLEASVAAVRSAAASAGRNPGDIGLSVLIDTIEPCEAGQVRAREEALCARRGAEPARLEACPYVLFGTPARMSELLAERRERLGLTSFIVRDGPHLELFMNEVAPAAGV
ncbi:MAG: LLM class flavin-dependent oxidoreductase [Acidimicrobiales bacterium]